MAFFDERDSLLGTVISRFSKDSDDISKYPSKNLLGIVMMKVRENLRALPEYKEELEEIGKKKRKVDTKYSDMMKKFKSD